MAREEAIAPAAEQAAEAFNEELDPDIEVWEGEEEASALSAELAALFARVQRYTDYDFYLELARTIRQLRLSIQQAYENVPESDTVRLAQLREQVDNAFKGEIELSYRIQLEEAWSNWFVRSGRDEAAEQEIPTYKIAPPEEEQEELFPEEELVAA